MIREDEYHWRGRPAHPDEWNDPMAGLMPGAWPTIDEIHALTMRVWLSPLHERVDALLVQSEEKLVLPPVVAGGYVRRGPRGAKKRRVQRPEDLDDALWE